MRTIYLSKREAKQLHDSASSEEARPKLQYIHVTRDHIESSTGHIATLIVQTQHLTRTIGKG